MNLRVIALLARVGRGDELPPVAARLEDFERRLVWNLEPPGGWLERRTGKLMRTLEPRDTTKADAMRITVTVDYLAPGLGNEAATIADYLPIFDRQRLLLAPKAGPLERFDGVQAPGYESYRFLGQAGEHNLVFLKHDGAFVRAITLAMSGDFDRSLSGIRPKLERMVSASELRLRD